MTLKAMSAALVALFATAAATGQGVASAASMSGPSVPDRAHMIAAEQSRSAAVGRSLGLARGDKLVVKDVILDPDGSTHVRYTRTFNGLRVLGGDFVSHPDRAGRLKSVTWNNSHEVAVISTRPRISLATATKGELVVFNGGATPRLAYDVLTEGVRPDQTPRRLHTVVDANTGAMISSWDEIETGTGNGIYVGSVPIGTTAGLVGFTMRDAVGNTTTDLNGVVDLVGSVLGSLFTDSDNIWGNGALSDRASVAVDAHYGAGKTFDYYKNVLGRNGIFNNGVGARSRVHYGSSYSNAFWDGSQMTYGDGAGDTHPLVGLDVAAHEMSHGVTQATAGLVYTGDAGGLNEANSDIFGTAVEWYTNNTSDVPDYLIGEKININGNGTPLRYMDRPSRDGVSRDCWSSTLGGLDPHYSSGPLNHWFYLVAEGSGAKTVNGISYNSPTCNGSTVALIGRAKAEKIWYRTLSTYLTSNSTYAAAREGAIQSALDLYGAGSTECAGVAASFSAIAVPAGAKTCGTNPVPPTGSNILLNPGFESGTVGWTSTPNVIGQNGANEPARTGTWNAWMGGYGLSHTDSISQSVAIPAGNQATLSYYVHVDTAETSPTGSLDVLTARAGSTVLQTTSNLNAASGFRLKTVDLSTYAGQTILLSFTGVENSSLQTSFVLDDTAVSVIPPATAPGTPTGVVATPGNAQAVVSWTAPASNGGSTITAYTVTASPGGSTATTTGALTAVVTGLSNGTGYTFSATARNVIGTSAASAPSAPVTPGLRAPVVLSPLDFTGDGRTDVLRVAANGDLMLYRGSGTGGIGAPTKIGSGWGGFVKLLSPGDFTGDHQSDILAAAANGDLFLYRGNGIGGFSGAGTRIGTGWQSLVSIFSPGDFSGDGRPDVMGITAAGDLFLYRGNGAGGWAAAGQKTGSGWLGMRITFSPRDFTGDGKSDVLAISRATGDLYLYAGNGTGGWLRNALKIGSGWQNLPTVFSPGDFTGDHRNDVMGVNASGDLFLYRGNGIGGWLGSGQKIATGLS